jgi:hypothetical protein
MFLRLVGSGNRVGGVDDTRIGDNLHILQTDRPSETNRGLCQLLHGPGISHLQRDHLQGAPELAFVELMVATDQSGQRLAISQIQQGFDQPIRRCF